MHFERYVQGSVRPGTVQVLLKGWSRVLEPSSRTARDAQVQVHVESLQHHDEGACPSNAVVCHSMGFLVSKSLCVGGQAIW